MFWGKKTVIAVAGGKGGIGKSCFVANCGVVLARQERDVVLIDADLGAANLHTLIGVPYPERTLDDFLSNRQTSLDGALVNTPYDHLRLLSSASDILSIASPDFKERQKLFRGIAHLKTEVIIFDIAAGAQQRALDFFSLAPIGVIIVEPIPTSLENAFSFLKNLLYRYLLRLFYHDPQTKAFIQSMVDPKTDQGTMQFAELLENLQEKSPEKTKAFRATFSPENYKMCLVVNTVRSPQQVQVAEKFIKIVKRYLDLEIINLGALPYEPLMDETICQRLPFVVKYPHSNYAAGMERVVANIPTDPK